MMKTLLLGCATLALGIATATAIAQVAPPPGVAQGTTPPPPPPPMIRPAPAPHVVMMMNHRTMTRAEVAEHVARMFARLDINHDGYLTREEVRAGHEQMMAMHRDMMKAHGERGMERAMPPMDRGAMFDRLDTNHDGSISRQEYMAARTEIRERRIIVMRDGQGGAPAPGMPPMPSGAGMKMRMHHQGMGMAMSERMFDMADTNHDGRVTLAEAQAAALAHFDRMDANHDGKITPDERPHGRMMRTERPAN